MPARREDNNYEYSSSSSSSFSWPDFRRRKQQKMTEVCCECPVTPLVSSKYCVTSSVELRLSKKDRSSFDVEDAQGHLLLTTKDMQVLDAAGVPLLCARKMSGDDEERWDVCSCERSSTACSSGCDVMDCCNEKSNVYFFVKKSESKAGIRVFLWGNDDITHPDFRVDADLTYATVCKGEKVVAQVKPKDTDKETFTVVITPCVDHAVITMLLLLVDVINVEQPQALP